MTRSCRVGLHGRDDTDFQEADYTTIRDARIETLKMLSLTRVEHFSEIRRRQPGLEFITQLHDGPSFGTHGHPSPEDFAQRMLPVLNQLQPYCTKFELHNEPNHPDRVEGWGETDEDAHDFNTWFLRVYDLLKSQCPWASLGFPGLAMPHRDLEWLEVCRPAVERADWLGVHCYWQTPPGQERNHLSDFWGLRFKLYHQKFPAKIIELTEAGNMNGPSGLPWSEESQTREFIEYLGECFKYPYLNSASFVILSSPDSTWDGLTWRSETGQSRRIVPAIGQMNRPPLAPVSPGVPVEIDPETLRQLQQHYNQLQTQLQQLQDQYLQLQVQLHQLSQHNNQLLGQFQQVQALLTGVGPQPGPVVPSPAPGPAKVPVPLIQDITQQLKHHPSLVYSTRSVDQIERIIIHHTAIPPTLGAERVANHRVEVQGWPGIGYHYFITGEGLLQQTNALTTISFHVGEQFNPVSVGICFAGDFTQTMPPPAQMEAGVHLIAWLLQELHLPVEAVFGYKELANTQSPGAQWDTGLRWGDQLKQRIQAYLAAGA